MVTLGTVASPYAYSSLAPCRMTPLYSWPVPGRNPGTSTNDTIGILKASQKRTKRAPLRDKIDEQKLYDILDKQKNIFYVRLRHTKYILDPHNVDDKDFSIIKRAFINSNFYSIDAVYVNFKQISRSEFMFLTKCKYLKIFVNEYYYNFDQICEK